MNNSEISSTIGQSSETNNTHGNSKTNNCLIEIFQTFLNNLENDGRYFDSNGVSIKNKLLECLSKKGFLNLGLHSELQQILNYSPSQDILGELTNEDCIFMELYNYNSPFFNTHVTDGHKLDNAELYIPKNLDSLKEDTSKQLSKTIEVNNKIQWLSVLKSKNPGLESKSSKEICEIILNSIENKYHPHILEMSSKEENIISKIIDDVTKGEKIIIATNHDTFANIPMIIYKFGLVAYSKGIYDIFDYITTLIGPQIFVENGQFALINGLSHIQVTHPVDKEVKGAERIVDLQKCNTKNQLLYDTSKDTEKGQIITIAISGTRDCPHIRKNGISTTFQPNEERKSNRATSLFINNLSKENPEIKTYVISTNTASMKNPQKKEGVTMNNNERNENADINIHIEEIQNISALTLVNAFTKGITYRDPSTQQNEDTTFNETACSIPVPPDIYKYIKKITKTEEYNKTGMLPQELFIDEDKGLLNFELIRKRIAEKEAKKIK